MQPVYHFRTLDDIENLIDKVAPLFPQEGKVRLGMRELMINAVEHGNLGISYQEKSDLLKQGGWKREVLRRLNMPEYQPRIATIKFNKQQKRLVLEISDEGGGFGWQEYMDMAEERLLHSHGRGIALAKQFCFDTLEYSPAGNTVKASVFIG
jgi:anti-sigma regulatory factor (Ser/Thr protein kinase)